MQDAKLGHPNDVVGDRSFSDLSADRLVGSWPMSGPIKRVDECMRSGKVACGAEM